MFGKLRGVSVLTQLASLLVINEPSTSYNFKLGAKEVIHTCRICHYSLSHTFHRCEAPGDNIVHTFSGKCSPVSHIFLVIAVQHITVQQLSSQLAIQKWTNVTPFGYINSTLLGHKSFKSCLPTVKSWRSSSDWNEKCLLIIKAYLMQRNYSLDFHGNGTFTPSSTISM